MNNDESEETETVVEFDTEFRQFYKENFGGDYIIEYVVLVTAMEPSSGEVYTSLMIPENQRPSTTAGLLHVGVLTSDQELRETLRDDDDGDDD